MVVKFITIQSYENECEIKFNGKQKKSLEEPFLRIK
jgi:hypothetical protein